MKTICLIFISVFVLAACKPDEMVIPAQPEQLVGEWQLVEPASAYTVTLRFAADSLTSTFPGHKGFRLSGQSSVNSYTAVALFSEGPSIESGPLGSGSIGGLSSTKKGGSPEAMQFEQTYFANLREVKRYEFTSQNRLRLYYDGTQPGTLVYKKIK